MGVFVSNTCKVLAKTAPPNKTFENVEEHDDPNLKSVLLLMILNLKPKNKKAMQI